MDGFNSTRRLSILTFSGFKRTIYYNKNKNLPIFFLATNISALSSSSLDLSNEMTIALTANTNNTTTSPLSSTQHKLPVRSRTGYVITSASCLVLWSSKLQTEIALSTTEAEYIALS
jgi:hypothetical protein